MRTSAKTMIRSSTMSQPTAMRPRSVSRSRLSCKTCKTNTVLATERASPKMTPAPQPQPRIWARPKPRRVTRAICPMAPGTAMLRTARRSFKEKCSPTPNMSRMMPREGAGVMLHFTRQFLGEATHGPRARRARCERSEPSRRVCVDNAGRARAPDHEIHHHGHKPVGKGTIGPAHSLLDGEEKLRLVAAADSVRKDVALQPLDVAAADPAYFPNFVGEDLKRRVDHLLTPPRLLLDAPGRHRSHGGRYPGRRAPARRFGEQRRDLPRPAAGECRRARTHLPGQLSFWAPPDPSPAAVAPALGAGPDRQRRFSRSGSDRLF